MKKNLVVLFLFLFVVIDVSAQDLAAGPMLGYNTMKETAIWVQSIDEGYLKIQFWEKDNPSIKRFSEKHLAQKSKGNTATIILDNLEPGTTYQYEIFLFDKKFDKVGVNEFTTQKLWHWREEPPEFSFLAGSCVYINEPKYDRPGKPYGKERTIFTSMEKEDSEFMVWLGDNNYLREADWNSRSGIYHRFGHSRQPTELQPLLSKMHHYAIWDDHDYGPNDSDRSYWMKDVTREAFTDFWANPNYGVGDLESITGTFIWNDCQFFMLDNRWYRSPKGEKGEILGEKQIKWLIEALRYSKASYKFICIGGQVLSTLEKYENYANFKQERTQMLNLLELHDIKNVVFLTGDRHHSEISKYTTAKGQVYFDVTSSPLTSKAYDHSDEINLNRLEKDALIGEPNYAKISVSGPLKKRILKVQFKNARGKILREYALWN